MQDSSYYLRQMSTNKEKIVITKKERDKYEKLHIELQLLLQRLPEVEDDLNAAKNSFQNGGYVSENETFDKGKLKNTNILLVNTIESINEVINKIKYKMIELEKEISRYENAYKIANINYEKSVSMKGENNV